MDKKNNIVRCQRCGQEITDDSGLCPNCEACVPKISKIKKEKTYYEQLKSTGDSINTLTSVVGAFMIIGTLLAFFVGFGTGIICTLTTICIYIFGSAINSLFTCIAEMAKNTEKQTELLEKLNEKLDK